MPKLTKPMRAVPEGEIYPVEFQVGDEVEGRLAENAKAMGCLETPATKPKAAPKKKAMKAPENK